MESRSMMTTFLLATAGSPAGAAGGKVVAPRERIVALAFDGGSRALLKAYPSALCRSGNEGCDWEPVPLPKAVDGGRIAAASISAHGKRTLYIAGSGFGVLRSFDGGRSWIAVNDGLPTREVGALTSHADQPETLHVVVIGHGIFRSDHSGDHWRLMDAGPREKTLQLVHSNMPGSMQTGWLFA